MFLVVIGLDVWLAPAVFVVTPAHAIAFDAVGRAFLGIWMLLTGVWVYIDSKREKDNYASIWAAAGVSAFWFIVTLLPAFFGDMTVPFLWFTLNGQINTISTLSWGAITAWLVSLYYRLEDEQRAVRASLLERMREEY